MPDLWPAPQRTLCGTPTDGGLRAIRPAAPSGGETASGRQGWLTSESHAGSGVCAVGRLCSIDLDRGIDILRVGDTD